MEKEEMIQKLKTIGFKSNFDKTVIDFIFESDEEKVRDSLFETYLKALTFGDIEPMKKNTIQVFTIMILEIARKI